MYLNIQKNCDNLRLEACFNLEEKHFIKRGTALTVYCSIWKYILTPVFTFFISHIL